MKPLHFAAAAVIASFVSAALAQYPRVPNYNIINNYLKPGPVTPAGEPSAYRLLKPESERSKTVFDNFGKASCRMPGKGDLR